jgi:methylamine dehydrogenase accessory protein MauD
VELAVAAHLGSWLLLLILGLLVLVLARQTSVLFARVAPAGALMVNSQLRVGASAPVVQAQALSGRSITIGDPAGSAGCSQLILFVAPDCPISRTLLPLVAGVAKSESVSGGAPVQLLIASDGGELAAHEALIRQFRLESANYLLNEELGRRYGIGKLPYAVLVDPDGVVSAYGIVNSREHLESLFAAQALGVASIQDYFELSSPTTEVLHHEVR